MTGLPATGKTFVGKRVREYLEKITSKSVVYIETDDVRKLFYKLTEPVIVDFGTNVFTEDKRQLIYDMIATFIEVLLGQNIPTIISGTFGASKIRKQMRSIAHQLNKPFLVFHTSCSDEIIRERIQLRLKEGKDPRFDVYLELKSRFEKIDQDHLLLNTELDIEQLMKNVIDYIDNTSKLNTKVTMG